MKIQDAVKLAVEGNPLYSLVMSTGLANLSAVARAIKPLVDAAAGKDVKIATIVKALERLEKSLMRSSPRPEDFRYVESVAYSGMAVAEGGRVDLNSIYSSGEPFVALSDGAKTWILAPARLLGRAEADRGLVKVVFPRQAPVGAVTLLVQLMRAVGISPEHVLRHDNQIYIVARREDLPGILSLVERVKKLAEGIR
ncbi:MAG: hypothetical protein RQ839_02820 [Thermoproteus sp.]|jgi:hypothetical protein|uniref:hypothetical protein n=1 Tax=Thermoproteus sp. CP80 TaxID=1650659 RepID=UPI0009BCA0BE|nr:hypothetical protein [Thermoproteus sp. CP80]MDT7869093.1 hypothetical protein [Thermoproteus sp.]MDT7881828.1 hypothetical protein [Thermoproteus sp.]PLC67050.1 hypothetical protein B7L68_01510 [Thermoproteus sp. CP80]